MREILFRGKRKGNNFWIRGDLVRKNNICYIYIAGIPREVDPETVGEFTGLCDKNGTRIFEGDIIKYSHRSINEKAIIKYGAPQERYTMYGWYLDDNHGNAAFLLSEYFIEFFDCVVIGNIHDNPELIGGL